MRSGASVDHDLRVQLGAAGRPDVAQVAAQRLDRLVERVDRRHEDSLSSSNRMRCLNFHHA